MYQWNAADYANNSKGQEHWAQELLGLLELRPDDRVLDIGCGDGRNTAAIAARVPRGEVVGVDLSEDMVSHAARHHSSGNLRFMQADASRLPFNDEFDWIFSSATLHWVKDHRPVLAGISKALKSNGHLVAQMGGAGNGAALIQAFDAVRASEAWRGDFSGFESSYGFHHPDDYRPWLQQAGFNVTECRLIPKDMRHANRTELHGWIRTAWLPYTSRVPEERRAAFIDSAIDVYLASNPPQRDGSISVRMMRLQVQAHKAA
jgi:trans-aconitate methyltransferase